MTHSDKTYISKDQELGQVEEKKFLLSEPFKFKNGELSNLEIAYESYGSLNQERTNCILLCHALTGDHHAAGYHEGDEKPGWWNHLIGPGKPIDTNIFFVVCSNCLGACGGSTGPASKSFEDTTRIYGMDFPDFTIKDMIRAQKALLDFLEVKNIEAVIGGSMGGMQALQWIVDFPEFV